MIGWSGRSEPSAVAKILPARLPPTAALGRRDLKLKNGVEGLEAERVMVHRESKCTQVSTGFYG